METLKHIAHQVSALNDLIRINNDRITGYKKRMDITLDDDLDDLFTEFIFQSRLAGIPFVFVSYGFGATDDHDIRFDNFDDFTAYFMGL